MDLQIDCAAIDSALHQAFLLFYETSSLTESRFILACQDVISLLSDISQLPQLTNPQERLLVETAENAVIMFSIYFLPTFTKKLRSSATLLDAATRSATLALLDAIELYTTNYSDFELQLKMAAIRQLLKDNELACYLSTYHTPNLPTCGSPTEHLIPTAFFPYAAQLEEHIANSSSTFSLSSCADSCESLQSLATSASEFSMDYLEPGDIDSDDVSSREYPKTFVCSTPESGSSSNGLSPIDLHRPRCTKPSTAESTSSPRVPVTTSDSLNLSGEEVIESSPNKKHDNPTPTRLPQPDRHSSPLVDLQELVIPKSGPFADKPALGRSENSNQSPEVATTELFTSKDTSQEAILTSSGSYDSLFSLSTLSPPPSSPPMDRSQLDDANESANEDPFQDSRSPRTKRENTRTQLGTSPSPLQDISFNNMSTPNSSLESGELVENVADIEPNSTPATFMTPIKTQKPQAEAPSSENRLYMAGRMGSKPHFRTQGYSRSAPRPRKARVPSDFIPLIRMGERFNTPSKESCGGDTTDKENVEEGEVVE